MYHNFIVHWSVAGLLAYFYILLLWRKPSMNMAEEMSVVSDCESNGYNSRSGTTGSYGRFNFSFLWVLYNDFHSGYTSLQFQQRNFVAQKKNMSRKNSRYVWPSYYCFISFRISILEAIDRWRHKDEKNKTRG